MRLFIEENQQILINPEVKLIPEFRKIITKDKDRFKKTAMKEFFYIYHMLDHSSPYSIYGEEEREVRVKKDSGLADSWKKDTDVSSAIKKYIKLTETPTIRSVKTIKESLLTSSKVIGIMQNDIEDSLKKMKDDPTVIDDIITRVEKLLGLSEKLPKAIESLTTLEEKVKAEQSKDSKLKGGGEINYFEK
jgi:hypothetical protein